MPTYEYECKNCGNEFELFQPITSEPRTTCPECEGEAKRLMSAGSGVIFKGSGFYVNDYKNKKPTKSDAPSCDKKSDSSACASCPASESK